MSGPYVTGVTECTYCGCAIEDHDPVYVVEGVPGGDAMPAPDGQFCNYGCLAAHVTEAGLAEGTACRVDLE